MEGMEEKLNSILGNPDMMQQIMHMAQALGSSAPEQAQSEPVVQETSVSSMIPVGLDPGMLAKLASMAQRSGVDPQQQALLKALQPYLSSVRLTKLEKAMRAAKLAGVASTFLGSGGLSFLTGR